MDKHLDVRKSAKVGGFIHQSGIGKSLISLYLGLAQIVSIGVTISLPAVRRRSDSEALMGDWIKVGGDMYAAIEHERHRAGK